ncbi:MAG: hypothetical protein RLZZ15_3188 [Verrucomicrobiota bacterium]|jgi:ankyrin repeat protein
MTEIEATKAIRAAILASDAQKALALISATENRLEMMTPFGTWLHVAAKTGCLEIVRGLVSMGADVNRRGGTFGGTAINLAAAYGRLEVVEFLLANRAELDVTEPERNPLFSAIQGGHLPIVQLLVERGIDTKVAYTGSSMKGMTALAFARERGQQEISEFLGRVR